MLLSGTQKEFNPSHIYKIGVSDVPSVNKFADLGVIISNDQPSAQCAKAAASAQRMLSVLKLAFRHLDIGALSILYKAFVLPLLEYCSVAWCPFYVKDILDLRRF